MWERLWVGRLRHNGRLLRMSLGGTILSSRVPSLRPDPLQPGLPARTTYGPGWHMSQRFMAAALTYCMNQPSGSALWSESPVPERGTWLYRHVHKNTGLTEKCHHGGCLFTETFGHVHFGQKGRAKRKPSLKRENHLVHKLNAPVLHWKANIFFFQIRPDVAPSVHFYWPNTPSQTSYSPRVIDYHILTGDNYPAAAIINTFCKRCTFNLENTHQNF